MKRTLIAIAVLLTSICHAATKPPPLGPNDVPFVYDPNLCLSPVMDFVQSEPNNVLVYAIGVHCQPGRTVTVAVGGMAGVVSLPVGDVPDPNGGRNYYFQVSGRVPDIEGVYYLNISATDSTGQRDARTVLVQALSYKPPFIFPVRGPIPTAYNYEAHKLTEYCKSVGLPVAWPDRMQLNQYPDLHKVVAAAIRANPYTAFERKLYSMQPLYQFP